jgi:uncharacterized membrane protein YcaP (DUF421 family)
MFSASLPEYLQIILRSSAVYLFMVFAIRLFGKKELSQISTSDLVLILLISNAVQNAMVGAGSTLDGGLVAAFTLFVINYLFKKVMYRFKAVTNFVEGEISVLIYKGVVNDAAIKKEQITRDELEEVVREHGVLKSENVELAVLERDGNISVVSKDFAGQTFHKRSKKLHPKHHRGS